MKTRLLLLTFLLEFSACTTKTTMDLTDQEKQTIQKEIRESVNYFIRMNQELKPDSVIIYFSNSPDFVTIGMDGKPTNFEDFKNMANEAFKGFSSISMSTTSDQIRFLSKDIVLYTWFYKAEIKTQTGSQLIFDNVGTSLVFKKIEGIWRPIYGHESYLPPRDITEKK